MSEDNAELPWTTLALGGRTTHTKVQRWQKGLPMTKWVPPLRDDERIGTWARLASVHPCSGRHCRVAVTALEPDRESIAAAQVRWRTVADADRGTLWPAQVATVARWV